MRASRPPNNRKGGAVARLGGVVCRGRRVGEVSKWVPINDVVFARLLYCCPRLTARRRGCGWMARVQATRGATGQSAVGRGPWAWSATLLLLQEADGGGRQ